MTISFPDVNAGGSSASTPLMPPLMPTLILKMLMPLMLMQMLVLVLLDVSKQTKIKMPDKCCFKDLDLPDGGGAGSQTETGGSSGGVQTK